VKPNVLFIVIDSLRADHTSVCDYERETTPSIEDLVDDGYGFSNAFSAAPWTPPSHGSMFSGLHPSNHGYFEGDMSLEAPHRLLGEVLRDEGYQTFGATRNWHIDSDKEVTDGIEEFLDTYRLPRIPRSLDQLKTEYLDLARGYASTLYHSFGADDRPSDYVSYEHLRKRIARDTPFFGFINISAPHSPYTPPKRFREEFESFDRDEVDMEFLRSLSSREGNALREVMAGQLELSASDWEAVKDWYDAEIRFADHLVGGLVSALRRNGLYDDTLVVVTSDHGEHFGEHGRTLHQFSLYDELLHVPLVIKPPASGRSREVDLGKLVSLTDLYPTILSELGHAVPSTVEGYDIFDSYRRDVIFAEYGLPATATSGMEEVLRNSTLKNIKAELFQSLQCVRTEEYKYVLRHGGGDQVYEIGAGPFKESLRPNLRREDLRDRITGELEANISTADGYSLDDASRENLKKLGYL
jgi:arylsulfatase A-like enzyme